MLQVHRQSAEVKKHEVEGKVPRAGDECSVTTKQQRLNSPPFGSRQDGPSPAPIGRVLPTSRRRCTGS
jgi:hypothetical protein